MDKCLFCGHPLRLLHVHGHYQCAICGTNAMPCCDGDNCDTNALLATASHLPEDKGAPSGNKPFSSKGQRDSTIA